MLRRLRKKLQRVEIWGWCPRATKENLKGAAYIDFEDFWNFLGSGCSQNEQSSIDSFSALPWPIWMIFGAFWSSVFILSFLVLFHEDLMWIFRYLMWIFGYFWEWWFFKWLYLRGSGMDLNDFWCILKLPDHTFNFFVLFHEDLTWIFRYLVWIFDYFW